MPAIVMTTSNSTNVNALLSLREDPLANKEANDEDDWRGLTQGDVALRGFSLWGGDGGAGRSTVQVVAIRGWIRESAKRRGSRTSLGRRSGMRG